MTNQSVTEAIATCDIRSTPEEIFDTRSKSCQEKSSQFSICRLLNLEESAATDAGTAAALSVQCSNVA